MSSHNNDSGSIHEWIDILRPRFIDADPALQHLFETYAGEAVFGRAYIADDLAGLNKSARIIEIGAGSLILSSQLVREGYDITSLEPLGEGYSHFEMLREIVIDESRKHQCLPSLLTITAESLNLTEKFDYAFSINVMEHIADPALALSKIISSLKDGAIYRFVCPNYIFPYEPHFNIPIIFSKKLTFNAFKTRILNSRFVPDAIGTWNSLNWINVYKVKRYALMQPNVALFFNRGYLVSLFERVITDFNFASRRSGWIVKFVRTVVSLRLHTLLKFWPLTLQPVMDCRVIKLERSQAN